MPCKMACWHRQPQFGLLHHSDCAVQYAASAYQALLDTFGLRGSMSRRANCWDNAVVESFFATLEGELIDCSDWHTHHEARLAVFVFIGLWYNRQRRHSSLGYLTPAEYDQRLAYSPEAA